MIHLYTNSNNLQLDLAIIQLVISYLTIIQTTYHKKLNIAQYPPQAGLREDTSKLEPEKFM